MPLLRPGTERAFVVERSLHERGVVVAGQVLQSKAFLEVADADIAQHGQVSHLDVHVLEGRGLVLRVDHGVDAAVGEVHLDDIVDTLVLAQQREPRAAEAHGVLGVAELRVAGGVLGEVRHVHLDSAAGGNQGLGRLLWPWPPSAALA